jgi:hypothetical protein
MNPLTMTDQELIEHASKQVQALRMALDMIECEKYERRHVRWAIIDALKEEPAAQWPVPEKRKWVGLTNQELIDLTSIYSGAPLYCAIEAKLKEKNT